MLLVGPKCQFDLQKGTDVGQLVEALLGEVEGVVLAVPGLDGEEEVVLLKGLLEPVDGCEVFDEVDALSSFRSLFSDGSSLFRALLFLAASFSRLRCSEQVLACVLSSIGSGISLQNIVCSDSKWCMSRAASLAL